MKKQALILSILVAVSSAAPVVAMDNQPNNQPNNQSTRSKRLQHVIYKALGFDHLIHAFRRFKQTVTATGKFRECVDTVVGDQKGNANSMAQDVKTAASNIAANLSNGFRDANIPGTEKIANDRDNALFKYLLGGVAVYIATLSFLNLFSSNNANQQA